MQMLGLIHKCANAFYIQSALDVGRCCTGKFTHLLKFICNLHIHAHGVFSSFEDTHRTAKKSESSTGSNVAEVEQGTLRRLLSALLV